MNHHLFFTSNWTLLLGLDHLSKLKTFNKTHLQKLLKLEVSYCTTNLEEDGTEVLHQEEATSNQPVHEESTQLITAKTTPALSMKIVLNFGLMAIFSHMVWSFGKNYLAVWFCFIWSSGFGLMSLPRVKSNISGACFIVRFISLCPNYLCQSCSSSPPLQIASKIDSNQGKA